MTEPITTLVPPDLVSTFRTRFAASLARHAAGIDANKFTTTLIRDMKAQQLAVISTLLGLKQDFSAWRIDNNGPFVAHLAQHAAPRIKQWVEEAVAEEIDSRKGELETRVKKAVQEAIRYRLDRLVDDAVEGAAREIVSRMVEAVKADFLQK